MKGICGGQRMIVKPTLEDKIHERIVYWENQYCNAAAFDENTSRHAAVLIELFGLIGKTWTPDGIFERDRARKTLAEMRKIHQPA